MQAARAAAIAAAEADLAAYTARIAPAVAKRERARAEKLAAAEAAVRESEKAADERRPAWESERTAQVVAWTPLTPLSATSTNGAKLEPRAGRQPVRQRPAGQNGLRTGV